MSGGHVTIAKALNAFLSEQRERLDPAALEEYESVCDLLISHLDGYGHQWLSEKESREWQERWEEDEEKNSFSNTFGSERIVENLDEFLGDFMVRKVMLPDDRLLRAAARMVSDLAGWLEREGYAPAVAAREVREMGRRGEEAFPRSDELAGLLYELGRANVGEAVEETSDDGEHTIVGIGDGLLRLESWDGSATLEVRVPQRACDLAEIGWRITGLLLGRKGDAWIVLGSGNVYPL